MATPRTRSIPFSVRRRPQGARPSTEAVTTAALLAAAAASIALLPSRARADEMTIEPTFYYLPETCRADAEWRMEGKALCRSRGVIFDWRFRAHPMFVALGGLDHAKQVLRAFGDRANIIHAFRSIATDTSVPPGTGLYLPAFDGLELVFDDTWIDHEGALKQGGRVVTHDGCFFKSDTGGAFKGKGWGRVDIYVGLKVNYREFLPGGRYADLNTEQRGVWWHPKCAEPRWDF